MPRGENITPEAPADTDKFVSGSTGDPGSWKLHTWAQIKTALSSALHLSNVVEDTTPQLGGDLDLNGNAIDFPTTANVTDCLDDDTMGTASATTLATSESVKAYADTKLAKAGGTMTKALYSTATEPKFAEAEKLALDGNGIYIWGPTTGDYLSFYYDTIGVQGRIVGNGEITNLEIDELDVDLASGNLTLSGGGTVDGVDVGAIPTTYAPLAGPTFTATTDISSGNLTLSGGGTVDGVDVGAIPATYVAVAGDTMAGNLAMGGNDVTGAGTVEATNIGANVTSPTLPLEVEATAVPSTRETVMKGTVSDGGNDAFFVTNGTSGGSRFAPSFSGYVDSHDTTYALNFRGLINTAKDTATSAFGIVNIELARTSSSSDPNNGTFSSVVTRNLFTIRNNTTEVFKIDAGGGVHMPGLPTSSAGLPSGALWNNSGVVTIV